MAAEFSDLARMIDSIGKEKGIDRNLIIDAVSQGMLMAARKKYGTYREIEASYNEELGEVELYEFKEVVQPENFVDEEVEIKLTEGRELDPECQIGDYIGVKLDSSGLGRIAVQAARQIITQKVRDAERDIIFQEFEDRRGEIASGTVRRVERRYGSTTGGTVIIDFGRTEAYLPQREQIPGEMYRQGDRVQGYIADVRQTTKGPQIIMSRADERYMVKLFEIEVPEIHDGIVEVVSAAREPGSRAKIAVISKDNAVDPVGACVGMKGIRVQNIVQELQGEKIDIIPFDQDITKFVCNALQPAEVSKVFIDEENKEMEVAVPDDHLSLAIGKKGQNVRLAAKLTGWHIDIVSESNVALRQKEAIFNLMMLPGMTETMAQNIYQCGFGTFEILAHSDLENVKSIPGYDENTASKLIEDAKNLLQKFKDEGKSIPTLIKEEDGVDTSKGKKVPADMKLKKLDKDSDAKLQAEEKLKELDKQEKQQTDIKDASEGTKNS